MKISLTLINNSQKTGLSVVSGRCLASRATRHKLATHPAWSGACHASCVVWCPLPVRRPSSAFTILEVLVAMVVLAILVLMAANIFQGSSQAWNIGTQKSDMNTSARAALDFIARELTAAVAGPAEESATMPAPPNITFVLRSGNELYFVALSGDPANGRALRGIHFKYNSTDHVLGYDRLTDSFNPYAPWGALPSPPPFIENVIDLNMTAFDNESDLNVGLGKLDYNSSDPGNSNNLPLCMDIAIEIMSTDDMAKYVASGKDASFRDRNSKLYSTRVYFPNRQGYRTR